MSWHYRTCRVSVTIYTDAEWENNRALGEDDPQSTKTPFRPRKRCPPTPSKHRLFRPGKELEDFGIGGTEGVPVPLGVDIGKQLRPDCDRSSLPRGDQSRFRPIMRQVSRFFEGPVALSAIIAPGPPSWPGTCRTGGSQERSDAGVFEGVRPLNGVFSIYGSVRLPGAERRRGV